MIRSARSEARPIAAKPSRHLALLGAVLALIAMGPRAAAAQESNDLERSVKAAFLYKFLGYVEWKSSKPPRPDAPMVIGVIAAPEMAGELSRTVSDRTVNGRPIQVRSFPEGASLVDLHVAFVGRAASERLEEIAWSAQEHSVLVVTEIPEGLDRGGAINFLLEDGHVRFEVSLAAADSCGLRLSSRMLSVAKSVRTEGP